MADEAVSETELTPARAAELIEGGVELIDVRRAFEWEGARLAGARHIEINELSAAAASIERAGPVLFYCRVGDRSGMAVEAFREAGYEAYNLAGGIVAWAEEGRPLDPEDGELRTPPPPS